jgi:hypothetical protein
MRVEALEGKLAAQDWNGRVIEDCNRLQVLAPQAALDRYCSTRYFQQELIPAIRRITGTGVFKHSNAAYSANRPCWLYNTGGA